MSPVSSVPKSYLADSRRLVIFGTDVTENAERHGLFFKYKAVASVSPVSSVPKNSNLCESVQSVVCVIIFPSLVEGLGVGLLKTNQPS